MKPSPKYGIEVSSKGFKISGNLIFPSATDCAIRIDPDAGFGEITDNTIICCAPLQ